MTLMQILLCLVFPPLAVMGKGCGTLLLTIAATCCGWVPGCLAAAYFCWRDNKREYEEPRHVTINVRVFNDPIAGQARESMSDGAVIQDAEIVTPAPSASTKLPAATKEQT